MNNEHYQGQISAEHDAQTDINKFLWLVVGFFANIIGILIAIIYQPTPPATRLLEKSQEYTAYYTDAYKAKARGIQLTYAIIGSVIPFALIFLLLLSGG
ncbi:MAG: hypothetical protein OXI43_04545 [Candidatus Poribacteria bacterium]|nr:hypothetical protein [Candidatus Poribacteria bacterium]